MRPGRQTATRAAPEKPTRAPGELKHATKLEHISRLEHAHNGNTPGLSVSDGPGRQRLTDIQRARMLTAMSEAATERGAANVTVAHVVERAGVSRRTFYELFDDIEDCLLAAFDEAAARASERVLAGYDPRARWAERIRASLVALLSFLDEDPYMGRLLVVESLAAGRAALERRRRVLVRAIAAVDEGRREGKQGPEPALLVAEGVVGAVLSVLHARMSQRERGQLLVGLVNPLMSMIVLPYLGAAASRRELQRPVPKPAHHSISGGVSNPLKQLEMRLTYRTVRVLAAVATSPGASNRMVGVGAGIGDQGQVSKLLARLEKLGLVSNTGLGPGRGAPNAWTLTERGEEVSGALTGHI
jgi:AcrR family transcriptional regulator